MASMTWKQTPTKYLTKKCDGVPNNYICEIQGNSLPSLIYIICNIKILNFLVVV